jgi:hypothetical protein
MIRSSSAACSTRGRTPGAGRVPVAISQRTTPKLQMSARWSTISPAACSGAMYTGVPITTPCCVAIVVTSR